MRCKIQCWHFRARWRGWERSVKRHRAFVGSKDAPTFQRVGQQTRTEADTVAHIFSKSCRQEKWFLEIGKTFKRNALKVRNRARTEASQGPVLRVLCALLLWFKSRGRQKYFELSRILKYTDTRGSNTETSILILAHTRASISASMSKTPQKKIRVWVYSEYHTWYYSCTLRTDHLFSSRSWSVKERSGKRKAEEGPAF